jgi:arsenate reductase
MRYQFVYYPKCTTCQKAKKWLNDNGVTYDERNIKDENPSVVELEEWQKKSDLPVKKFFNTSGLLYKSMQLKEKLPKMCDTEMFAMLATNGMLVKRPILVAGNRVLVGFKEDEWKQIK